jgi:hypothetical protein
MSVFHSPRCRITWAHVAVDQADRNVVAPDQRLDLSFGVEVDPTLSTDFGFWRISWRAYRVSNPTDVYETDIVGLNSNFPAFGTGWLYRWWDRADRFLGWGSYRFEAQLYFRVGGKARDEFAFSEEPQYFLVSAS